jgi:hypothetical protein
MVTATGAFKTAAALAGTPQVLPGQALTGQALPGQGKNSAGRKVQQQCWQESTARACITDSLHKSAIHSTQCPWQHVMSAANAQHYCHLCCWLCPAEQLIAQLPAMRKNPSVEQAISSRVNTNEFYQDTYVPETDLRVSSSSSSGNTSSSNRQGRRQQCPCRQLLKELFVPFGCPWRCWLALLASACSGGPAGHP